MEVMWDSHVSREECQADFRSSKSVKATWQSEWSRHCCVLWRVEHCSTVRVPDFARNTNNTKMSPSLCVCTVCRCSQIKRQAVVDSALFCGNTVGFILFRNL